MNRSALPISFVRRAGLSLAMAALVGVAALVVLITFANDAAGDGDSRFRRNSRGGAACGARGRIAGRRSLRIG